MYNEIDDYQTGDYIKIACTLFVEKCCDKYLETWMKTYMMSGMQPTPLPLDPMWMKKFDLATRDPDKKLQAKLVREMQLLYRSVVGELIWAMTTCHPDLRYVGVKLSQANYCLHKPITTVSEMRSSTSMSQRMMGYIFGERHQEI